MTPYQNVAKAALMNWNGLTEEQANQKIQTESVQELESQVYAMSSMEHATLGVANELGLGEEEKEQLWNAVINGPENAEIFSTVAQKANGFTNEQILNVLSTIHDGWVIDNSSDKTFQKKVDREQLRQYAPLELIGWNEVQSDLLFLNPILSSIGVSVNENQLSASYHERVAKYFEQNNIDDYVSLVSLLEQGRQYYPTLPENLENNLKSMTGTMASQIVSNWTKKDSQTEQLFESRFDRILNGREVQEMPSNVTPSTVVTTDAVDLPTSQVTVENSNRSPAPMFPTETELFTDSQHSMADVPDEALAEMLGPDAVITRHSDGRVTFHQKQVGNDSISSTPIEVGEPVSSTPIEVESPIDGFDNTSMGQPLTEDNSTQRVIDLMQQAKPTKDDQNIPINFQKPDTFTNTGSVVKLSPITPVETNLKHEDTQADNASVSSEEKPVEATDEIQNILGKLHASIENLISTNEKISAIQKAAEQAKAAHDEAIREAEKITADLEKLERYYHQGRKDSSIVSEPIPVDGPIDGIDDTMIGAPIEENTTSKVMGLMQQAMQDQMADGKTVGIVDNTKVTFDENGTIVDVEPIAPVEQADTSSKTM